MSNNKKEIRSNSIAGFTIVELLIVIVVIAILATFTAISYNSGKSSTNDTSVLSDIDNMDGAQTRYGIANDVAGKDYYSGLSGERDDDLDFSPSPGNIVDVVIDTSEYCIRAYNVESSYDSIVNAATKESSPGACSSLSASAMAMSESP